MPLDRNNQRRKRMANGIYVFVLNGYHALLNLLPSMLRVLLWKPFLESCGRGVMIDHRVYFKYPWLVSIGNDTSINRGVEFYPGLMAKARISIGCGVRIAPNVRFHATGHDPDDPELGEIGADIVVGDGVWLGAAALVLPGVAIGPRAIVAAGAVVTTDVPADAIIAGVPARVLRFRGAVA